MKGMGWMVLAGLSLAPTLGSAFTGQELRAACDAGDKSASGKSGFKTVGDAYDGGLCVGYVHGVNDGLEDDLCPPRGTTIGQEVGLVRKYLAAHPERRNQDAYASVRDALRIGYACPRPEAGEGSIDHIMKDDRFADWAAWSVCRVSRRWYRRGYHSRRSAGFG